MNMQGNCEKKNGAEPRDGNVYPGYSEYVRRALSRNDMEALRKELRSIESNLSNELRNQQSYENERAG